jgi:hypothetical protein
MKVQETDINTILPYAWNSKVHTQEQITRIANSISRFGFNQPLVIDEQNIILVGHGRFQAAQMLKLKKVPVVKLVDLSDSEKRAYRVIDNKVAADTSWDLGNLEIEVKALAEAGYDAEVFHFEEFKFEPEPEPEPTPEPEEKEHQWCGEIKIKISADQIDSFEQRLDDLIREFEGVVKETKRVK